MEKLVYVPKRRTLPAPAWAGGPERVRVRTEPALVVSLPWGVDLTFTLSQLKENPEFLEEALSDLEGLGVDVKALRRNIARTPFRMFLSRA